MKYIALLLILTLTAGMCQITVFASETEGSPEPSYPAQADSEQETPQQVTVSGTEGEGLSLQKQAELLLQEMAEQETAGEAAGDQAAANSADSTAGTFFITSADNLRELSELVSSGAVYGENHLYADASYVLDADIDLSGMNWEPVGNSENPFNGSFDGNGHVISNMSIDSGGDYAGLFGYVENASFRNIRLTDINISGTQTRIGGIAGYVQKSATFTDCSVTGTISAEEEEKSNLYVGGIMGRNNDAYGGNVTMSGCSSDVTITLNNPYGRVGGIAGSLDPGSIDSCFSLGSIRGRASYIGGIMGRAGDVDVTDCYSGGTIEASCGGAGGIVGYLDTSDVKNCYTTSSVSCNGEVVSGQEQMAGGIAGMVAGKCTAAGCVALNPLLSGEIYGSTAAYLFLTWSSLSSENCYVSDQTKKEGSLQEGSTTESDVHTLTWTEEGFSASWAEIFDDLSAWENTGNDCLPTLRNGILEQSSAVPDYLISCLKIGTAEELADFRDRVNEGESFSGMTVTLTEDIDLSAYENWEQIGKGSSRSFKGIFDGAGHTVSGLKINAKNMSNIGLFGCINDADAVIRNLNIRNCDITTEVSDAAGAVVGSVQAGRIENCSSSGNIAGRSSIGGIVGSLGDDTEISGCSSSASVSGSGSDIGGIAGNAGENASIRDCFSSGIVSASNTKSGAGEQAGGIVGSLDSSAAVSGCYSAGDVSATNGMVGGIVGEGDSSTTVENCYATGNIRGAGSSIGGILGRTYGAVRNCYFSGAVSGEDVGRVGGIVGSFYGDSGTAVSCAALGRSVTGSKETGRIYGYKSRTATVTGCYASKDLILTGGTLDGNEGTNTQNGASGEKADLVLNAELFPESAWTLEEGYYPVLTALSGDGYPDQRRSIGGLEEEGPYYTVSVNLDGTLWENSGHDFSLKLQDSGEEGESITDFSRIPEGTYDFYDNGSDTGLDITVPSDAVIDYYTVSFYDGDTVYGEDTLQKPQMILSGKTVSEPAGPVKAGYRFDGWTAEDGSPFDFNTPVTEKTALYASWTKTGGSGGGSSSGSGSGTDTDIIENEDGSVTTIVTESDGTVTSTTEYTDGSVVRVTEKPDGTVLTTETTADGIRSDTVKTPEGETETEINIPASVTEEFQSRDESLSLPMSPVSADGGSEESPVVTVITNSSEPLRVEIPAENPTPGTVAVLVREDGTEEIVRTCVASQTGIILTVENGAVIRITDNSREFEDVSSGSWYYDAVGFVSSRELFHGISDSAFGPDLAVSRAMMVTALWRLENNPQAGSSSFTDVEENAYYAQAVSWAQENGIVTGISETEFSPDSVITREQMTAILYRYAAWKGEDVTASSDLSGYRDTDQISSYAVSAMQWAHASGLIRGISDAVMAPDGESSRAQMAAVLMRFCEYIAE